MKFIPTRADPDLWIKPTKDGSKYAYIATYVDGIIIVAVDPKEYLEVLQSRFTIRNVEMTPDYYLGNNLEMRQNNTIRLSSKSISQKRYVNMKRNTGR